MTVAIPADVVFGVEIGEDFIAQEARVEVDAITDKLTGLLDGMEARVLKDDLWKALGRPDAAGRSQRDMNALTMCVQQMGWKDDHQRHPNYDSRRRPCYSKNSDEWLTFDARDFVKL